MSREPVCNSLELPLIMGPRDVQRLMDVSRQWAVAVMKRGEEAGAYKLARIGRGKNARLRVHRDRFLEYLG